AGGATSVPAEEDAPKYENPFAAMSSLPDPAMIAKLANEFFAALPHSHVPLGTATTSLPTEIESIGDPGAAPAGVPLNPSPNVPDAAIASPMTAPPSFPSVNDMFSFPDVP